MSDAQPPEPGPVAATEPTGEVRAVLEGIASDNEELVSRWVEVLRGVGGIYARMEDDTLAFTARGTIELVRSLAFGRDLTDADIGRFVDAPPYREQPVAEFALATMKVERLLRDFVRERTGDVAVADAALARLEPPMAAALTRVLRAREQRLGSNRLLQAVSAILGQRASHQDAFQSVARRIADELDLPVCFIGVVEDDHLVTYATSRAFPRLGIRAGARHPHRDLHWLDRIDESGVGVDHVLSERAPEPEAAWYRAGYKRLHARPLVALGRPVGVLGVISSSDAAFSARVEETLRAVGPVIAAPLDLARKLGTIERSEVALQELYDAAPSMLCDLDHLGRILRTNARFRDEVQMPEDVVGMPLTWLVHPAWLKRWTQLWDRIQQSDRVDGERLDLITSSGERLPVSLEAHWLRDELGEPTECVVAMWNVSVHVDREAAQSQRIDELDAFAHRLAHDLKAPLRTIAGFTAILTDELPDDAPSDLREFAERAQQAAEQGGRMVDSLLRFSQETGEESAARPVQLQTLLGDVRVQLAGELRDRGAALEVGLDATPLLGQRVPLVTLLVNLVSNAINYSDGDAPRIEVGVEVHSPGWARLYVQDEGIGIAEEAQERIFELFQRVSEERPGTGVGLAIVRRIAQNHGGEVWVDSSLGAGSTFSVKLPTP